MTVWKFHSAKHGILPNELAATGHAQFAAHFEHEPARERHVVT
jgi:hypothetical protein